MRTDFREERKWKVALAHDLALACKAWYDASPEDRPSHCAKWLRPLEAAEAAEDDAMVEDTEAETDAPTQPTQPVAEPMIVEGWQPPAYGTPHGRALSFLHLDFSSLSTALCRLSRLRSRFQDQESAEEAHLPQRVRVSGAQV